MPVLLALLLAGAVEISVLILVGQTIGALQTVGLLFASAMVGVWLLRREGRRTLREFSEATRLRRPPTRELADGVIIAAGGFLVLLPGFVSDVVGLLCLLPPTRAWARHRLQRAAERRAQRLEEQMRAQAEHVYGTAQTRAPGADGDVIDGEVVSVEEDETPTESPGRALPRDRAERREPPFTDDNRHSSS